MSELLTPVEETFQEPVAPIFLDEMYRRLIPPIRGILCVMTAMGDIVQLTEIPATTALSILRAPEPLAMRTNVKNTGTQIAQLFEDGHLIGYAFPGQAQDLPGRGKLEIEAQTETGSTYFTITTDRRNACGDAQEFIAIDETPIGQFLL